MPGDSRQKRGRQMGEGQGDADTGWCTQEGDGAEKKAFLGHRLHLCLCVHCRRRSDLRAQESREHVGRRENHRPNERPEIKSII